MHSLPLLGNDCPHHRVDVVGRRTGRRSRPRHRMASWPGTWRSGAGARRRRRRVAGRAAGVRDAAHRRLRRARHADRRRAAPALRPAAAVEEAARRRVGARPHRPAPAATTSTPSGSTCASASPATGARRRRSRRRAGRRHDRAVRRARPGHRFGAAPPARPGGVGERPRAAHARRLARPAGRDRRRHGAASSSSAPGSSASRSPRRRAARGCAVTVLEGLPAPLIRGLGAEMGAAATAVHAAEGIDIRCDVTVAELRADGVALGDGTLVPADVVVVGIGVAPATGWLEGSGLELRDGVVCDATLAAGPPGVYAAGDIARWPNDAVRRGDARRALDQRRRAGCRRRPQPAGRGRAAERRRRTRRCRSSGATRPATASSSSAAPPSTATTTWSRSSSASPPSTASSPSTAGADGCGACSASTCPRLVMPYSEPPRRAP